MCPFSLKESTISGIKIELTYTIIGTVCCIGTWARKETDTDSTYNTLLSPSSLPPSLHPSPLPLSLSLSLSLSHSPPPPPSLSLSLSSPLTLSPSARTCNMTFLLSLFRRGSTTSYPGLPWQWDQQSAAG